MSVTQPRPMSQHHLSNAGYEETSQTDAYNCGIGPTFGPLPSVEDVDAKANMTFPDQRTVGVSSSKDNPEC
jgi:hypothetical protein